MFPHMRRAAGPKGKPGIFVGGSAGVEVASIIQAPVYASDSTGVVTSSLAGSTSLAHPAPGYKGGIEFWLVGTASRPGQDSFDGKFQPQASGETGRYTYTCLGDETGFVLEQWGWNQTDAYLRLKISGGVNNGRYVDVGSASPNAGYGASGCPLSRAETVSNWPGLSLVKSGARRPYNSVISYSDSTSYGPGDYASYGSTVIDNETRAGAALTSYYAGGQNNTGLIYNGNKYGEATQYGYGTPTNVNTRSAASRGAALIIWRNNA